MHVKAIGTIAWHIEPTAKSCELYVLLTQHVCSV